MQEKIRRAAALSIPLFPLVLTAPAFSIYINLLFIMNTGFSRTVSSAAKWLFPWQSILQIIVNIITLFDNVRNVSKMEKESPALGREKTLSFFMCT